MKIIKLVLLGAPGAGKGTLAQELCQDLHLKHISVGDILRDNMKNKTELGEKASQYIANGQLVPDDLIVELIKIRLSETDCKNGYVLDGYPRTIKQAEELDKIDTITNVINIDVDNAVIVDRIVNRLVCSQCGAIYNRRWGNAGVCPKCAGSFKVRNDDKEEIILTRLAVYDKETKPLLDYYKGKSYFKNIDGNTTPDVVLEKVKGVINDNN